MQSRKWFYRQLFSYMPAFFIVISFIFFVFFQLLSDQSRKEAVKANETLLLQAMSSIDASLKTIEQMLMTKMLKNTDISAFYNRGTQNDYYMNIKLVEFMNGFKNAYPLVDSIYFVRTKDSFILSSATSSSLRDYPDYPFIRPYINQEMKDVGWTSVRNFEEFSIKGPKRVVTLALKAPFLKTGQGFLVVNVSADAINNSIASMYSQDVSYIHILDESGRDILPINEAAKKQNIVSSAISPVTGWEYQSGLMNGKWFSVANQLYNIWFMLGILMILAGVAWIVYAAKKNYRPIEQIVTQVQKFSQNKATTLLHGNGQDEFTFLQTAINQMLEQSNSYQRQYREDLHVKKAYLFQQLMEGQHFTRPEEWEAMRNTMQLNDFAKRQVACVVEMDKYAQFCSLFTQQDQYLMKFALKSVIQETAQEHGSFAWSEWVSNDALGVLLQVEEPGNQIAEILDHARRWVEEHLKLTVTIGAGGTASSFSEIPDSYAQAQQALKYKMILGDNRIIFYDLLEKEEHGGMFDYFQLVHSIAQSFRLGKEEWREKYKTLIRSIEQNLLSSDHILSLADYLIYSIGREMNKMTKEYQELWEHAGRSLLQEAVQVSDTLEQVETGFEEALGRFYGELQQIQETRNHSETIRRVREYMDLNFANPDLCLDLLSDRFSLPSKTLSKLFKEETGQKFVDYLIELRIGYAQDLLARTDLTVQEIAEEVGYVNAISFGRMFKKIVCLSPGEYRDQVIRENRDMTAL
ncbi:helix-turn-helix domain-containing protein [Paenibacillus sp. HJL G12]|uniref:Helix-turn-helix domain-containing protein n=1 Tax=Paenibacillus dendrobii TaxID=2691084 RepID=A0A7X3IK87_9BACL|nr:helix-turn-helix domain-containing protein [Paenibacillus dendrobii]MWV45468.1 helix-turn-helix domain-containing protein [Paenibacillus dendrobii]